MNVLYIGGTGEISTSCVQAGLAAGQQVTVFNRGRSGSALPAGARQITGDLNDLAGYRQLGQQTWDVVCQFKAYDLARIELDLELFGGKVGQYLFISSASAYQKPPTGHVITEDIPVVNPSWPYSAAKAAMEARLMQAHRAGQLPVTIVRPSHTYRTRFPGTFISGDHLAWRMLQGKPAVVHGDGTALWTLTHADDFAVPFVRLLGNPKALGEAFHITSDQAWMWRHILEAIGAALGVEPQLACVPTDTLVRYRPDWAGPLWGDKAWSVVFDNSKVKRVAGDWTCATAMPQGMRRVAEYFHPRRDAFAPDPALDALVDRIVSDQAHLGQA